MATTTATLLDTTFKKEVFEGLSAFPKYLSSKYFYDKKGDKLFQEIMAMPEYYLTECEFQILSSHTETIGELFRDRENGLDLIELGAGDGKKTKVLLKYMAENNFNFIYKPIDISENAVEMLSNNLAEEMPALNVDAEVGEYFEVLERLKGFNKRKKVIMVLGSNIGNLKHPKAIEFLTQLKDVMLRDDLLFMGFDQKKNPQSILNAYNDKSGITAAFNKNILTRINRELEGNFDIEKFTHWESYNPETGTAKSFLVANEAMQVTIEKLQLTVNFDQWETIHTEISQKYDDKTVQWLAEKSGLEIETSFTDEKEYYKNYAFRKL
ncbi:MULTISPECIES: L-histidine N(alpha)-methyltransferase [Aequorivita]|uniref:L-histidine N(Alpha)-methyltransferase n=1 Tax=Aequorivita iocasae TaxID=2803865 RepID=A0ABX7DU24_9FLAO|nr:MULTISPECIES: L-histidine N(alpha)-methyltransferase [Aequorivita]QQX77242.1 L-histidine N(alpha)-methyltransferase [Aequorivita iocasae]UCA56730.1 L-histidine N(alpha)-methyltransferase [Aequorivita sp. F7]